MPVASLEEHLAALLVALASFPCLPHLCDGLYLDTNPFVTLVEWRHELLP